MNFTGYPGINPELLELLGMGSQTTTAPTTDPTYSSGFDYARSIAGGIPASQMIASGVSYSPKSSSGYTQKDLDMISAGPAPIFPVAPTTGDVATIENQMEFAPPGVSEPTRFMPFLQGLDVSGLPGMNFLENLPNIQNLPYQDMDFTKMDFSQIRPNFEMPQIPQPTIEPKTGLLGGIGRGISGLQGMQKDFTGFKEDLKNKAANKVRGLFGI